MTKTIWCENLGLMQLQIQAEQMPELAEHASAIARILKPLYETEKKSQKPILSEQNKKKVFDQERLKFPDMYYNYSDGEIRIELYRGRKGYGVKFCNWKEIQEHEPRKLGGEKVYAEVKAGWVRYGEWETVEEANRKLKILVCEYVSETLV